MGNKYIFLFFWIASLCVMFAACNKDKEIGDDTGNLLPSEELETEVHNVWDDASFSASSDLIWFKDAFYCTFREDTNDPLSKGRVRVVKSVDGTTWETVKVFEFTDLPTPAEPVDYLEFNMPWPLGESPVAPQSMTIPYDDEFDFTMDDVFSLSAWVWREYKTDPSAVSGSNNDGAFVSTRHANSARGYVFQARPNTFILDFGTTGGSNYRRHNTDSQIGFKFLKWEHIGFVYDGPNKKVWLYINGAKAPVLSNQTNDLREDGNDVNTVGNNIAVFGTAKSGINDIPTSVTPGKIRALRFWKKVMTDDDMYNEWVAGKDVPVTASTDLIAGYDFASHNLEWNGTDWIVRDVKGNHPGILHNFNFALYGTPSADLQAPRLSIAPGNRLMLQIYGEYDRADGSVAKRRPYISFSDDGETFSDMVPSEVYHNNELSNEDFRISGVAWDQTTLNAYGFDLTNPLTLFKTTDGMTFRAQAELTGIEGTPRDVSVCFDKRNVMYALIRKDDSQADVLAVGAPPYNDVEYHTLDFNLYGASFAFLDNNTLVMGARGYDDSAAIHIVVTDLSGKVLKSVPVLVEDVAGHLGGITVHDKYLCLSYSASRDEKSDIYMVKIPLADMKP